MSALLKRAERLNKIWQKSNLTYTFKAVMDDDEKEKYLNARASSDNNDNLILFNVGCKGINKDKGDLNGN